MWERFFCVFLYVVKVVGISGRERRALINEMKELQTEATGGEMAAILEEYFPRVRECVNGAPRRITTDTGVSDPLCTECHQHHAHHKRRRHESPREAHAAPEQHQVPPQVRRLPALGREGAGPCTSSSRTRSRSPATPPDSLKELSALLLRQRH